MFRCLQAAVSFRLREFSLPENKHGRLTILTIVPVMNFWLERSFSCHLPLLYINIYKRYSLTFYVCLPVETPSVYFTTFYSLIPSEAACDTESHRRIQWHESLRKGWGNRIWSMCLRTWRLLQLECHPNTVAVSKKLWEQKVSCRSCSSASKSSDKTAHFLAISLKVMIWLVSITTFQQPFGWAWQRTSKIAWDM